MMNNVVLGQSTFVGSQPIARTTQVAKIIASNGVAGARFGWALSLSLDGNTLAVGADLHTGGGKTYICTRSGGTWTEQAIISTSGSNTSFGRSLSLSGDGNTLLVGCISSSFDGRVFVYTRSGGSWTQLTELIVPSRAADSGYGITVEMSKDGLWAIVGEPGSSLGNLVHTFRFASGSWVFNSTLTPTGGYLAPFYGNCLALNPDASTLVVGATNGNNDGTGDIYIYTRSGTAWTLQIKARGTGVVGITSFGISLAVNDAGDRVFAGSGRNGFWWYKLITGSWVEQSRLPTSFYGSDEGCGYGMSVSPDGTLVFLGAAGANFANFGAGIVRAFRESGGTWTEVSSFIASDAAFNAHLGTLVRNNYFCHTVAAAAAGDVNVNGSGAGAVYVYDPGSLVLPSDGVVAQTLTVTTSLIAVSAVGDTGPGAILPVTTTLIPGAASGPAGTTVLLMHFNGTNGAASYIDSSASPLTITEATGFGENLLSTSSPKLGSACLSSNTPNGDMLYTTQGTTSKLNLGTGPFNIQCFVKLTSGHGSVFFYQSALFTNFFNIIITNTNRLAMQCPGGNTTFSTTTLFTPGIWQHLEVSRDASGVIRGFIEGTLLGTTRTYTGDLSASSADFWLFGGSDGSTTTDWDELRVVVGDAVHTASFTPPTTELT